MEKVNNFMFKVMEASKKAQPLTYINNQSVEYIQELDEYSPRMTSAMIRDMRDLSEVIRVDDGETSKKLKNMCKIIAHKDIQLRRLFDDVNDDRPLIDYEFADTDDIVDNLAEIRNNYKEYSDKLKSWAIQITQIDTWAYYLTTYRWTSDTFKDIKYEIYDISDEDVGLVKILLSMEQIMLKSLIKIPLEEALSSECLEKIEIMNAFIKAIIEKDKETLDKFYKYFDAVKDFSD